MFRIDKEKMLGVASQSLRAESRSFNLGASVKLSADVSQGPAGGSGNTSNISGITTNFTTGVLESFIPKASSLILNELYREIYIYDAVSGPAVDLMAMLPYSEFSLSGISDPKVLSVFEDSVQELNVIDMMRQLTVSYLVLGKIIGSLVFNDSKGIFTDLIIHNPDLCETTPIPLRGYDPKINLKLSPEFVKFLRSSDQRDKEARSEIPPDLLKKMLQSNKIDLEPISTLYIARSNVPGVESISYYSRILPMWLIEKALLRGTIIGAWRRQRAILHVTIGNDDWEPNQEQLGAIGQMFASADIDPQGAVVVTRQGVETNELRQGNDFWRVSDEWDVFANAKMRALGINESFLSGDATYNSMDTALSVFIENLKSFREFMTASVFYNKIFLMLAKYHGFKKRTTAEMTHGVRLSSNSDKSRGNLDEMEGKLRFSGYNNLGQRITAQGHRIFGSKDTTFAKEFMIPEILWHKQLEPNSDSNMLDILDKAQEKGIPVPLRKIASAAGLNMDKVLEDLDYDIQVREKIKAYQDKLKEKGLSTGSSGGDDSAGGGDDSGSDVFGSVDELDEVIAGLPEEKVLTASEAAGVVDTLAASGMCEKPAQNRILTG